jgi:hypothetical protein
VKQEERNHDMTTQDEDKFIAIEVILRAMVNDDELDLEFKSRACHSLAALYNFKTADQQSSNKAVCVINTPERNG